MWYAVVWVCIPVHMCILMWMCVCTLTYTWLPFWKLPKARKKSQQFKYLAFPQFRTMPVPSSLKAKKWQPGPLLLYGAPSSTVAKLLPQCWGTISGGLNAAPVQKPNNNKTFKGRSCKIKHFPNIVTMPRIQFNIYVNIEYLVSSHKSPPHAQQLALNWKLPSMPRSRETEPMRRRKS